MKLEATTFRPREVVKHALQTAAASLKKELILEGCIHDDVPLEVLKINYILIVYNVKIVYLCIYKLNTISFRKKMMYLLIQFK